MEESFVKILCKDSEDWLSKRFIGGSSASVILGLNHYKNKRELYDELMSDEPKESIDTPFTRYGHEAEPHLRNLFALHHPELKVIPPNDKEPIILQSKAYPFMTGTLDGELVDIETGKKGIYEGKTCLVSNSSTLQDWKEDNIPDTYYCQLLHYFAITHYDFAYLYVELRWERYDEKGHKSVYSQLKEYYFIRQNCQADIDILVEAEKEFYTNHIIAKKRPNDSITLNI